MGTGARRLLLKMDASENYHEYFLSVNSTGVQFIDTSCEPIRINPRKGVLPTMQAACMALLFVPQLQGSTANLMTLVAALFRDRHRGSSMPVPSLNPPQLRRSLHTVPRVRPRPSTTRPLREARRSPVGPARGSPRNSGVRPVSRTPGRGNSRCCRCPRCRSLSDPWPTAILILCSQPRTILR